MCSRSWISLRGIFRWLTSTASSSTSFWFTCSVSPYPARMAYLPEEGGYGCLHRTQAAAMKRAGQKVVTASSMSGEHGASESGRLCEARATIDCHACSRVCCQNSDAGWLVCSGAGTPPRSLCAPLYKPLPYRKEVRLVGLYVKGEQSEVDRSRHLFFKGR